MTSRRTFVMVQSALALCAALAAPSVHAQDAATGARQDSARRGAGAGLPLPVTRHIRYTADRGTWMSLDVSPDGRTIVFDLMGDLFSMPIEGGKATRLTGGMAFDAQPRFSPDGKSIVFVTDRTGGENLWTLSLDMRDTVQVTRGNTNIYTSPEWTPDGKYIVASRTFGLGGIAKLWLFHTGGGSGTQLGPEGAQAAQTKMVGAAFGPDPRYLYFAQAQGDWQYNATLPRYQVQVYDRENGRTTPITARYGSGFRPAVSPDGRWLVYGSRHESETGLRKRDLQTGAEEWLLFPVHRDDQEARATLDVLPGYAFTPDSKSLIVSAGGEFLQVPLDRSAPKRITFSADMDIPLGPEVRSVYRIDESPTFTAKQIRDAVPSPDGKQLAFSALGSVYVMALPGGTPRRGGIL